MLPVLFSPLPTGGRVITSINPAFPHGVDGSRSWFPFPCTGLGGGELAVGGDRSQRHCLSEAHCETRQRSALLTYFKDSDITTPGQAVTQSLWESGYQTQEASPRAALETPTPLSELAMRSASSWAAPHPPGYTEDSGLGEQQRPPSTHKL